MNAQHHSDHQPIDLRQGDPRYDELAELAQQLRVDGVRAAAQAGSGHPTSSMSAAELIAVLLARHLRYDFDQPQHRGNDHLIFSKGHASVLLYAAYKAAGAIDDDELLSYRELDSRLEGHPTPRLPWVDVATGSLGQGLPIGVGLARAGRDLDRLDYRVWVLTGDSELTEGSIWEAVEHAGYVGLGNLTALVDMNRLGQRGPTRYGWDGDTYAHRMEAFGWHTIQVEGHEVAQIDDAYAQALTMTHRPTAIIARTTKGRGVQGVADREGLHGKALTDSDQAIEELGGTRHHRVQVAAPIASPNTGSPDTDSAEPAPLRLPTYQVDDTEATRTAFGSALAAVGDSRPEVVGLDGEVADSTRMQYFADAHPERFFQFYIAEQQMLAAAVGFQVRGWVPYVATFAAFLSRAYDFTRMAAISRASIRLVGSHAGTATGPDGPSQMGLEDLAALRAIHGSTVLYPCDANQTAQLVAAMADRHGISYLRTTRGATPVLYSPDTRFAIGSSHTLRSSTDDAVTLVAAGVTVGEALRAADELREAGVAARVIDAYSIKPIDAPTLRQAARETGRLVTVEDHWPEGGLGDAVLDVFADGHVGPAVIKLAPRAMPTSGQPDEQLATAGIDAGTIAHTAHALVSGEQRPHQVTSTR